MFDVDAPTTETLPLIETERPKSVAPGAVAWEANVAAVMAAVTGTARSPFAHARVDSAVPATVATQYAYVVPATAAASVYVAAPTASAVVVSSVPSR